MKNSTFKRYKRKIHNFFFDHIRLTVAIDYSVTTIIAALSAFIFGIGFCCFATPSIDGSITIITGGASGISQIVSVIFQLCGVNVDGNIIESVAFFVINVPLIVLSFKFIGKRFAILTLVNVALTSVFMSALEDVEFVKQIATAVQSEGGGNLCRALFAGLCTGLSSAIAFKGYFSCGGIDIITYYISLKKSSNTGKYNAITNASILIIYTILSIFLAISNGSAIMDPVLGIMYAAVYLVVVVLVIDLINVRNKKAQIQIITTQQHLADVLLSNFPHAITILNAEGGYSKKPQFVLIMVVSSSEVRKAVAVAKASDNKAFIQVTHLSSVYGKFYIAPVK